MIEDFKPVLRNKHFIYLWSSQIFSQLTINIMNFILLTRLFSVTRSTIATSLLWVAYALPAIFVGPIAYSIVDVSDRKKILMLTNLFQALTVFSYIYFHETSLFLLYGVVLGYSFWNQFYWPAEAASLPSLVKENYLVHANSLFFITQQGSLILGYGIAGLLNHLLGFRNTLFLCSFFLFAAFIVVSHLPSMKPKDSLPEDLDKKIIAFFGRILDGYLFIKNHRSIIGPFLLLSSLQIGLSIVIILLPVMATNIIRININSAGVLLVAPAGVGAGVGAYIVSKQIKSGWRKKRIIELSLKIMVVTLILISIVVPLIGNIFRIFLAIFLVALAGVSFVGVAIPSQTFLQEATPGGFRGRVFGNFWFLVTVAGIFPVIFSGALAELFGIRLLLILLAAIISGGLILSRKYGEKFIAAKI